ncbi:MAG: hypothetical protein RI988_2246 [Pseudomonadota bacterium]
MRMLAVLLGGATVLQAAPRAAPPVTAEQRAAAERTAQAGVPLADLAADAPARHTVQPGDTLWGLAGLFLRSPWRWPELWGMNLEQLRNPHRLYPGQTLVLVRDAESARARLVVASAQGAGPAEPEGPPGLEGLPTQRSSPRARAEALPALPIAPVSARELAPYLSETVVLESDALALAPRIVGSRDGRLLLSQGETAYVLGDLGGQQEFRVFREPVALRDPISGEVLGYEARFVGRARAVAADPSAAVRAGAGTPAALRLTHTRLEATVGDRLAPPAAMEWSGFVPRAPQAAVEARVVSVLGEALSAGQKQLVAVNRGARDGLERGHVLALWRAGERRAPSAATAPTRTQPALQFPDERHGTAMLVQVFERVSYALILDVAEPVRVGDRLTQP